MVGKRLVPGFGVLEPILDRTGTLDPAAELTLTPVGLLATASHNLLTFQTAGDQNVPAVAVGLLATAGHNVFNVGVFTPCCGTYFGRARSLACFSEFQAQCCDR